MTLSNFSSLSVLFSVVFQNSPLFRSKTASLLLRNKSRSYWLPFRELSLQLRANKRKKQNKDEAYLSRRHAITKLLKRDRREIRSDMAACFSEIARVWRMRGVKRDLFKLEKCNSDIGNHLSRCHLNRVVF